MFRQLVLLFHNSNSDIHSATRDALLRLTVCSSLPPLQLRFPFSFDESFEYFLNSMYS